MIVYLYYIYFVNGNVTTRSVTAVKTKLMITKILAIVKFISLHLIIVYYNTFTFCSHYIIYIIRLNIYYNVLAITLRSNIIIYMLLFCSTVR